MLLQPSWLLLSPFLLIEAVEQRSERSLCERQPSSERRHEATTTEDFDGRTGREAPPKKKVEQKAALLLLLLLRRKILQLRDRTSHDHLIKKRATSENKFTHNTANL